MLNTRVDRLRVPIVPEPMTYTKARVKEADRGVDMETAGLRVEQAARRDPNRGWNWDLSVFEPRRWLVRDENGGEVFDGNALPTLVFGGGFRGCFGKLATKLLGFLVKRGADHIDCRQEACHEGTADYHHHACAQFRVLAPTARAVEHGGRGKAVSQA